MGEAIKFKNELSGIENNFNHAVTKAPFTAINSEFKDWIFTCEVEKKILFKKVDEVKITFEKWLRNGCCN